MSSGVIGGEGLSIRGLGVGPSPVFVSAVVRKCSWSEREGGGQRPRLRLGGSGRFLCWNMMMSSMMSQECWRRSFNELDHFEW